MRPELKVLIVLVVFYFVVWLSLHSMLILREVVFKETTKLELPAQEKWLAGLQHVQTLNIVFALSGSACSPLLYFAGRDILWSFLCGLVVSVMVHIYRIRRHRIR